MRKNLLCHRCIVVPLRVPVCTLTNKTENGKLKTENQLVLTFHLSPFTSHQGLRLARSTARLSCCRCTTFIIGAVTISYRLASIMPILISAVGFLCCDTTLAI